MSKVRKYQLKGGGIIEGSEPLELVKILRFRSMNPCENIAEFLRQTASACELQTGAKINTNCFEEFINSLVANGFLKEVE
jgi:hypothetical protein